MKRTDRPMGKHSDAHDKRYQLLAACSTDTAVGTVVDDVVVVVVAEARRTQVSIRRDHRRKQGSMGMRDFDCIEESLGSHYVTRQNIVERLLYGLAKLVENTMLLMQIFDLGYEGMIAVAGNEETEVVVDDEEIEVAVGGLGTAEDDGRLDRVRSRG